MDAETIAAARLYAEGLVAAAKALGASPSGTFGLWDVPGYPELTNAQMMQVWRERHAQ